MFCSTYVWFANSCVKPIALVSCVETGMNYRSLLPFNLRPVLACLRFLAQNPEFFLALLSSLKLKKKIHVSRVFNIYAFKIYTLNIGGLCTFFPLSLLGLFAQFPLDACFSNLWMHKNHLNHP